MNFRFDKDTLSDFQANIHREWAITNGIGGYAGSSILGAHNRTHQGYLIASYHPPVERYMVFSKTNEAIHTASDSWDFTTAQHAADDAGTPVYQPGNRYLTEFCYDGNVHFTYQAGNLTIRKTICMVQGQNKTVVLYDVENAGEDATLCVTPLFNYREHSESSTPETLQFDTQVRRGLTPQESCKILLFPKLAPNHRYIRLSCSPCEITDNERLYDVNMQLQTEVDNEVAGLDCNFTPYQIHFAVPAHSSCRHALICDTGEWDGTLSNGEASIDTTRMYSGDMSSDSIPSSTGDALGDVLGDVLDDALGNVLDDAIRYYDASVDYYRSLMERAAYGTDDFANTLVLAANQFLAHRDSTGLMTVLAGLPWFTDWGRDTMIAFTGLTLCTKRFDEAADILKTFAMYVHHGMVPNMFPDNGAAPMYNTVDASLWYFYAVERYLHYVNTPEAWDYIHREIYPALCEIMRAYQAGTDFSIYMDSDGLIHAGSGLDQVTWMDVRVGDWVATPRHGKPVEINALWYNALCVMQMLANRFGDCEDAKEYAQLSDRVKASFRQEFWYEEGGYLYDVVDDNEKDSSLRPNQIYAISLPYTMLSAEENASIIQVVEAKLLAGPGLRSLSPDHKDYHPIYLGALAKRDAAYHQGTAWGFLMGGFISAYMKVHHHSAQAVAQAMHFLAPVREHFTENCIGSICEIFDGDAPHLGRGCYAQAWSVGEVLRCYEEDVAPYLH